MNQRRIASDKQTGTSAFGRKRLDRSDPHGWADQLEDWFARIVNHVLILYVLAFIGVAHTAWALLGWLDDVIR